MRIIILAFIFNFLSCSGASYNLNQYSKTYEFLPCIEAINQALSDNDKLWDKNGFKKERKLGEKELLFMEDKFRLISKSKLDKFLNHEARSCINETELLTYFKGARIPSKHNIIIDVNKFDRSTHATYYSSNKLVETHRIIFSKDDESALDIKNYSSKKSRIVLYEKINKSTTYIISQTEF